MPLKKTLKKIKKVVDKVLKICYYMVYQLKGVIKYDKGRI